MNLIFKNRVNDVSKSQLYVSVFVLQTKYINAPLIFKQWVCLLTWKKADHLPSASRISAHSTVYLLSLFQINN